MALACTRSKNQKFFISEGWPKTPSALPLAFRGPLVDSLYMVELKLDVN